MRELIEFTVRGLRCRGTVHLPNPPGGFEGLGVIILHPGFLPRSALGDGGVSLAEGLARKGILTVRVDQPGLGDSEGELPKEALAFLQAVQDGCLADDGWECIAAVKSQLGLKRVIVGGLCGGAVSGFFALAKRSENSVAGMFSVDMMFNRVFAAESPLAKSDNGKVQETLRDVRLVAYEMARKAILKTPLGSPMQKLYRAARGQQPPPANDGNQVTLPPEANVELMLRVQKVISSELPVLFVTAEQPHKEGEAPYDYLGELLSGNPANTTHNRVFGTDHAFLAGDGTPRLIAHITDWMGTQFAAGRQHAGAEVAKS